METQNIFTTEPELLHNALDAARKMCEFHRQDAENLRKEVGYLRQHLDIARQNLVEATALIAEKDNLLYDLSKKIAAMLSDKECSAAIAKVFASSI